VLPRTGKHIAGTVLGPDGAPIAFARVGVDREDEDSPYFTEHGSPLAVEATFTADDGTFTVDDIGEGKYTVWADSEELPRGATHGVTPGDEGVTVKLPAGSSIEGEVKDERGAVVTGILVHVDGSRDRELRVSSTEGHFEVGGLPKGEYNVAVEAFSASGGPVSRPLSAQATVDLAESETKKLSFVVRAPTTIAGRVVSWPEMTPLSGVVLDVIGALRTETAPTDESGRFTLEAPAAGRVGLRTFDAQGASEKWVRDLPPAQTSADISDLACAKPRGGLSFGYEIDGKRALATKFAEGGLGIEEGEEIVSLDGHPVATLGANSLAGLLSTAAPDVPVVVKSADGRMRTVHRAPKK
jgi:hypothetical protein